MPEQASLFPPEPQDVVVRGRKGSLAVEVRPLPPSGEVRRYVLTSAQNNTHVHEAVWLNVLAMAQHHDAEVIVGTFSYDKSSYGAKSTKRGKAPVGEDLDDLWYDPQIIEHIVDSPVRLAPGLMWCGEMNIIPTAEDPLSMLDAYNGRDSNVVPHAKFAMTSVAALDGEAAKLNYTTGTVTQRNYIQKKAGLKAERYHGYGALLVEVCSNGSWFVRQLEAAADCSLRDLTLKAADGEVTDGHPVECISWGDAHVRVMDPSVRSMAWGEGGMLDALRPRLQVLHDVIDFRSRNHHEEKDPLLYFQKWQHGLDSVSDEVIEVVSFMDDMAARDWCETVVAPSNHHEAMIRWLKETDWRKDPANAIFYHKAWVALLEGCRDVFEWSCYELGLTRAAFGRKGHRLRQRFRFLRDDESLVVAKSAGSTEGAGIEVGMHGHLGVDGARGNAKSFVKLGRKSTIGHMHSAAIRLGVWVAGTSSLLRIGYNRGPSSWSHSHVVHYPEGTRQMVTMWKGKWRA